MIKKQRREAKLWNAARAFTGGSYTAPQKMAKARVVRWFNRCDEAGDKLPIPAGK